MKWDRQWWGETPTMLSIKIDESLIFLILYVDDMLIDTKITSKIEHFKCILSSEFDKKDFLC